MSCLVLGGGGFIGQATVRALLHSGREARVFDRYASRVARSFDGAARVRWIDGDFRDSAALHQALDGVETVVHLVSTTVPQTSNDDPGFDIESNVVGSIDLFRACVANGVRRLVFLSSGGTVYGIPRRIPVDESHPTDPLVSYGIHKLAVEKYLGLYRRLEGLDSVILRVSNPYGPCQRPGSSQGVIATFMHRALTGKPIDIWGDGSVTRDYVFVDDVAQAIVRAATGEALTDAGGPINIGSGAGLSLLQIISEIERIIGQPIERRFHPARPFDVPVNILSIDRAAEVLGWRPRTPLAQGLAMTRAWMADHLAD